jgi:hypothetical protein
MFEVTPRQPLYPCGNLPHRVESSTMSQIVEQGIVMPDAAYRLLRVGSGMHKHGRRMMILDLPDYAEWAWCNLSLRRADGGNYYAATTYKGQTVDLHRLILGVTDPNVYVDHLDGFGLNNRRYNLNPTTPRGNMETKKRWDIERDRQSGLYWVVVTAADGSDSRFGPYSSYSQAHEERYSKRDYWGLWA